MRSLTRCFLVGAGLLAALGVGAQEVSESTSALLDDREQMIRDRYEQALARNPFQGQTFDRVYQSYLEVEGLPQWVTKLEEERKSAEEPFASLVLLARIRDRQFRAEDAITHLEEAQKTGSDPPELLFLLSSLYAQSSRDHDAIELLASSLDSLSQSDTLSKILRLLGNLYLRHGQQEEAIKVWERLVAQTPDDIFAHLELAEIYEDNRLWAEAIGVYEKLRELSLDDPYRQCRTLRSIAHCLTQQEKFPEAITVLETALELAAPGNWLFEDIKERLVTVYQDIGDLEGLTEYLLARLESSPGNSEFRSLLAETYTRRGDLERAELEYRAILERDPSRIRAFESLIDLYAESERTDEVYSTYESLIEAYPAEPDYLRRLGEVYLRDAKPEEAKAVWARHTSDNPTARAWALLAGWYEDHGFLEQARGAYEEAISMRPSRDWSLRLAMLHHDMDNSEAALATWRTMLDADESSGAEYYEVATSMSSMGYDQDAQENLEAALGKDPENFEYRLALARNLAGNENHEAALTHFEALVVLQENDYFRNQGERGMIDAFTSLGILTEKQQAWEEDARTHPDDPEVLMRLARLYRHTGNREGAVTLLEKCAELRPEDTSYLRELARSYRGTRDKEKTIDAYVRLIEVDSNRSRAYYRELLKIYIGTNRRNEAIEAAEHIVELAPSDPEAHVDLAQVYSLYGQNEKALQEYRNAIRLEAGSPEYYRQYGQALVKSRQLGQAQEAYRKMMGIAENDAIRLSAVQELTKLYQRQNQTERLVEEFQARVRNTPKKLAAYQELSAIHQQTGDFSAAVEVMERGYQEGDDTVSALRSLVRLSSEANDSEKVVRYFEALLDASGQPSYLDFQRLGIVYARMGDMTKAREVWGKIGQSDSVTPRAFTSLARALKQSGFIDDGIEAYAKAVALAPDDFRLRFAYAGELSLANRPERGLEEMIAVLDRGDTSDGLKDSSAVTTLRPTLSRRDTAVRQTYRFAIGQPPMIYRRGTAWQGGYDEFRPQLVAAIATSAQSQGVGPELIEDFKGRIETGAQGFQAKLDLLQVYETMSRSSEAMSTIESLLEERPENVTLTERAGYLAAWYGDYPAAVEHFDNLIELDSTKEPQTRLALLSLHLQNGEEAAADAMEEVILGVDKAQMGPVQSVGQVYQRMGRSDKLIELYADAEIEDPGMRQSLQAQLAVAYETTGQREKAADIYSQQLFSETQQQRGARPARVAPIYIPRAQRNTGYYGAGNIIHNITRTGAVQNVDNMRARAFGKLTELQEEDALQDTLEKLSVIINAYDPKAETEDEERNRAWQTVMLLVAYYLEESDYSAAQDLLDRAERLGLNDLELYNLRVLVHERQGDFALMLDAYDRMADRFPDLELQWRRARTMASVHAKEFDRAQIDAEEFLGQSLNERENHEVLYAFVNNGEAERAWELYESTFSEVKRTPATLRLLARMYSEMDRHDEALDAIREAWDAPVSRSAGRMGIGGMGRVPSVNRRSTGVRELHAYASRAHKTEELLEEFESILEREPTSLSHHQNLATLYDLENRRNEALEVYERLVQRHPSNVQGKITLSDQYTRRGKLEAALAILKPMMSSRPAMFRDLSRRVRDLYRRMGDGAGLEELENQIIQKATNANQFMQIANDYVNRREYEKAVPLFARAIQMEPVNVYVRGLLADAYLKIGEVDKATEEVSKIISGRNGQRFGRTNQPMIERIVGVYSATGRKEELELLVDSLPKLSQFDPYVLSLRAHMALQDKNPDKALSLFRESQRLRTDPTIMNKMIEVLEDLGRSDEIYELVKDSSTAGRYMDINRLSKHYFVGGHVEEAIESLTTFARQRGGSQGYRQALDSLMNRGLWEEADDFYQAMRKERPDVLAHLGDTIARGYLSGKAFQGSIESLLNDPIDSESIALLRTFTRQEVGGGREGQELMRQMLERDPENIEILNLLSTSYTRHGLHGQALDTYAKLRMLSPEKMEYDLSYVSVLERLGRKSEALDLLKQQFENAKRHEPRIVEKLVRSLGQSYRMREVEELKETYADGVERDGNPEGVRALVMARSAWGAVEEVESFLRQESESVQDVESLKRHFDFLTRSGYSSEAFDLFVEQTRSGRFNQWGGNMSSLVPIAIQRGNHDAIAASILDALRFAQHWQPQSHTYPVMTAYRRAGRPLHFVEALDRQMQSKGEGSPRLLKVLAELYASTGSVERATALYDEFLLKRPLDQAALRARARLEGAPGVAGLSLETLEQLPTPHLRNEVIAHELKIIEALLDAGALEEAGDGIEALLSWSAKASSQMSIANIFWRREEYQQALPYLELAAKYDPHVNRAAEKLAISYARLGRSDEAITTWNRYSFHSSFRSFPNRLVEHGLFEFAATVASAILQANPAELDVYIALAKASFEAKLPGGYREPFLRGYEKLLPTERRFLTGRYASFLLTNDLFGDALQEKEKDAALLAALAQAFYQIASGEQPDVAREYIESLPSIDEFDPPSQLFIARGLHNCGENALSGEWAESAVSSGEVHYPDTIVAARVLSNAARYSIAADLFAKEIPEDPSLLFRYPEAVEALARSGQEANRKLIVDIANEVFGEPVHTAYFGALIDYYVGDPSGALNTMGDLLDEPQLLTNQLLFLARLFEEHSRVEDEIRVYKRIATARVPDVQSREAYVKWIDLMLKQGDFEKAFTLYAELLPVPSNESVMVENLLGESITREGLSALRLALGDLVSASPDADRNSELVGLFVEFAESLGESVEAEALAEELKMSAVEIEEAATWDRLIEEWVLLTPKERRAAPRVSRLRLPESLDFYNSRSDNGWYRSEVHADEMLGAVELDRVRALHTVPHSAYAVAEIECTEERVSTFTFGADGLCAVWVNGDKVIELSEVGHALTDQLRFRAKLVAGKNVIVVERKAAQSGLRFYLGHHEDPAGLVLSKAS